MLVTNKKGKKKIELIDDKLILHFLFNTEIIEVKDIRSALITKDGLHILNYDNKYTEMYFNKMDNRQKKQLKQLVDKISKENVLFSKCDDLMIPTYAIGLFLSMIVMDILKDSFILGVTAFFVTLIAIILIFKNISYPMVIYSTVFKKFKILNTKGKEKLEFGLDKVKDIKTNSIYTNFNVEKGTYKPFRINKIIYPLCIEKDLKELEVKRYGN